MDGENNASRISRLWFLGFGVYWAWVYLSFNSAQVSTMAAGDELAITWLHVISGLTGCITYLVVILNHNMFERASKASTLMWFSAVVSSFGSLFYALPIIQNDIVSLALGAVLPGLATPFIAVGWGVQYCTLDARRAASLTAGSFLVSGLLFGLISFIPEPLSGVVVTFLPLLSVTCMTMCPTRSYNVFSVRTHPRKAFNSAKAIQELKELISGPFSSFAIIGIFLTMVVCGGLRTYIGLSSPDVYHNPLIVAAANVILASLFLIYSLSISPTNFKLGPIYRVAAPVFAVGIAVLTILNEPDSAVSYFAASAGSMLIDMPTWVLLIEIARTSRFSALLIFATGRFAIHSGMAIGELVALAAPNSIFAFGISSIVILVIVSGFMFSGKDGSLEFEPVAEGELPNVYPENQAAQQETPTQAVTTRVEAVAQANGLTARETEVLTLWASGHGAKSIEEKLVLSSATVRTHVRHIYEKCDVHSRAELIELLEAEA